MGFFSFFSFIIEDEGEEDFLCMNFQELKKINYLNESKFFWGNLKLNKIF